MGKRIVIILGVFLILVLVIMGYFLQQGRKPLLTDPYKTISTGACIVIETVDLQSFINSLTTGKGLFGEIAKVRELESFNRKLKYIADQLNRTEYKKFVPDGPAIISFYPTKEGKLETLLSMTVPGDIRYRHIKEMLSSSGIKEVIESKYSRTPVLKIPYAVDDIRDTAYVSLISGLMICSSSAGLFQSTCKQMEMGKDIRSLPGFSRVLLASGKKEDKIFVVFANLPNLIKPAMAGLGEGLTDKIIKLAGTAGGDIYINEEGLVLSGYTESTDSTEFIYRYKLLPPREFHTYKILPSSTVLFESIIQPDEKIVGNSGSAVSQKSF